MGGSLENLLSTAGLAMISTGRRFSAARHVIPVLSWLALVLVPATLHAQEGAPSGAEADQAPRWSYTVAAYGYFVPDSDYFTLPVVKADGENLHLEGRYNYEARGAGSVFAGWTFHMGDEVSVDVTPMLGGVFGDLSGIAPGVELNLDYKGLNFYYEGEYVRDLNDEEGSFIYGWSELTYAPTEWFRAGLVGQRTRLYETDLDIQRGLLVGFSYRWLDVAGYFFNPGGGDDAFEVVSLSVRF